MEIDETSYNALVARVDYLYKHIGNIKKDAYKAAEKKYLGTRMESLFKKVSGLEMDFSHLDQTVDWVRTELEDDYPILQVDEEDII